MARARPASRSESAVPSLGGHYFHQLQETSEATGEVKLTDERGERAAAAVGLGLGLAEPSAGLAGGQIALGSRPTNRSRPFWRPPYVNPPTNMSATGASLNSRPMHSGCAT